MLAGLDSPELAERAGDVRQVAQAVLEHLAGGMPARPHGDFILVRREVAAADLIELADEGLAGAVSVAGGASSHAAIIARGLGLPMLTGVDAGVLAAAPGASAPGCRGPAIAGELRSPGPGPGVAPASTKAWPPAVAPTDGLQRRPHTRRERGRRRRRRCLDRGWSPDSDLVQRRLGRGNKARTGRGRCRSRAAANRDRFHGRDLRGPPLRSTSGSLARSSRS